MTVPHVTLRHRFFFGAPVEHLEEPRGQRGLPPGRITTPYTLLLADTGEHHLLVNTRRAT